MCKTRRACGVELPVLRLLICPTDALRCARTCQSWTRLRGLGQIAIWLRGLGRSTCRLSRSVRRFRCRRRGRRRCSRCRNCCATRQAHLHAAHLDRRDWPVVLRGHLRDRDHDIEALFVYALAEHGMFAVPRCVPVQNVIVVDVHEKLRASRIRRACVRHRKRPSVVPNLNCELIWDCAASAARDNATIPKICKAGFVSWPACARTRIVRVLGIRAPKLYHK